MKKSEIEKRLKASISNSVPDVLDNILIECEKIKGVEKDMEVMRKEEKVKENKTNKLFQPKLVAVLAMAMICLCGIFGINEYNKTNNAIDSIVEFDVNPSIELKLNKNEKIVEAIALNEDGKKIIGDMDLKNTDIDVAVNALVGSMMKNGYISNDANSILVSVKNEDIEKGNKLQERISKEIEEILKANSIDGAILTQMYDENDEIKKIATENNVSEGKAKLINKIQKSELKDAKGNVISSESLAKLSINELNLLVTSKETQLEDVHTTGNASENSYIGKEKAKEIAYKNAQVASANVTRANVELDYDDGKLVYEVEFNVGNKEYDYEIDAETGAILEVDRDYDDDDRNTVNNNQSTSTSTSSSKNNSTNTDKTTNQSNTNKNTSTSISTSTSVNHDRYDDDDDYDDYDDKYDDDHDDDDEEDDDDRYDDDDDDNDRD